MANISAFAAKLMLDWIAGGATPTRPTGFFVALCSGTPQYTGATASEINTGSGYTRQTLTMASANSPQQSATNLGALDFGPFSSSNVVLGIAIFDTLSNFSGNQLWQGTIQSPRTVLPGDTFTIAAGSLTVTLS